MTRLAGPPGIGHEFACYLWNVWRRPSVGSKRGRLLGGLSLQ